jgi:hypothetical protein
MSNDSRLGSPAHYGQGSFVFIQTAQGNTAVGSFVTQFVFFVLPCVFDDMSAMETHDKNTTGVQQELLQIIQSDEARELIESMVNRMAVIEEAYYRIRELREAVQPYIPEDSEHDKEYWIAAYLVKPHASNVIEKFRQLREIQHKLANLEEQVQKMESKESSLEDKLAEVESAQENMGDKIYQLIGKEADPYMKFGNSDLYDLLYESIYKWAAKQLSTNRS